jgi:hypothetical protein
MNNDRHEILLEMKVCLETKIRKLIYGKKISIFLHRDFRLDNRINQEF